MDENLDSQKVYGVSAARTIEKSIQTIRKKLDPPPRNEREVSNIGVSMHRLLNSGIAIDHEPELLKLVLDFAEELEAYRGKGRRYFMRLMADRIAAWSLFLPSTLARNDAAAGDPAGERATMESNQALETCLEMLKQHSFQLVQGPPVRSRDAATLRARSWDALTWASAYNRNPVHLEYAIQVAGNDKYSPEERAAAVQFLVEYWEGDDPDDATVEVLEKLRADPPDRECLVVIMQAQIDLGLASEFCALDALDRWDDRQEKE